MILIIGSGVSSLAFAEKCRQNDVEYRIIEKSHFGGKARSYDSTCGNGRFDIAGHFLHFPGKEPRIAGINFNFPLREKNAKVILDDKLYDFPIQSEFKKDHIFDNLHRWDTYPENSMTEFFVKNFGDLAWKFFVPYNRKIWNISTDILEQEHFEKFRSPTKGKGYNNMFVYSDSGAQAVPDTIGKHVKKDIEFGEVISIEPFTKKAIIKNGDSYESFQYTKVLSPMPLPDLCKIVNGFENISNKLQWSSVIIFNIIYKTKSSTRFDDVSWLYLPNHKSKMFRCGWYSHVSKKMAKKGYESIYVEVSFPGVLDGNISINDYKYEVLLDLVEIEVLENISQVTTIDPIIVEKAYPLSVNDKQGQVDAIKKTLEANNIYPVGRYGLWRWTGMYADMKYSEELFNSLYKNNSDLD